MSSDPAPDQSAADGYVQRAQLLAELGRYDEAAGELAYGLALQPDDVDALTMLARVHLAAGRPAEALTAA
ncbi:tetratricopeptide repeat protein, partial [Micromonospora saelicesensis]